MLFSESFFFFTSVSRVREGEVLKPESVAGFGVGKGFSGFIVQPCLTLGMHF